MINTHSITHDGTPFFDEIGWVGFIQKSQNWVCTPWFIHNVINPATENSPNLKAMKFSNFGGRLADKDVDGQPMQLDISSTVELDYYKTHFIVYPYYITDTTNNWRLIVVPEEVEKFNSYFIWGGTVNAWHSFRPHLEAMPSTIPIESEELAGRDPRQWVFTKPNPAIPDVVLKGMGTLQFAGQAGLSWE